MDFERKGVSTSLVVAVVVVIAILVVAGIYVAFHSSPAVSSSTSSTTSSTTSSSTTPSNTSSSTTGGTIVVEEPGAIDSLDPASAFATPGGEAIDQVYQGLLGYTSNSTLVPLLAQSYNVSSNGLTYSFQLRNNITFSNGDPFNAYVMWYSEYRVAVMEQSDSYLLTVAVNTTGVTAAELNEFNTTNNIPPPNLMQMMENPSLGITVTGPYSLQFHLPTPFGPFLSTLTQLNGFAVDPRVVSQHGGVNTSSNTYMTFNAVGTGPFIVSSYTPDEQIVFQRNPVYWGGANGVQPTPKVDEVIVKYVSSALTRLEDLEEGSAQVITLDPTLISQASSDSNLYFPTFNTQTIMFMTSMDTQKFPFNNTLIREAVEHAVNYTALLSLYHGHGQTTVGPIPQGVLGSDPALQQYSYNVSLAKQLLVQAGYPNGQGIPAITILGTSDVFESSDVIQVLASDLANIGITAHTSDVPTAQEITLLTGITGQNASYPDMISGAWAYVPDPWGYANWLVGPLSYGFGNFAYYNNTQVNQLLNQATNTANQTLRAELYTQIDQIVYNDAPYIWVAQGVNAQIAGTVVVSSNVEGYSANVGFWGADFSQLYYAS